MKKSQFAWQFAISPIKASGTRSTEVQLNCRHAVNKRYIPIFRAGPTLTQLATGIFQSLSVCRGKWWHLRTLVIFLAAKTVRQPAGASLWQTPRWFHAASGRQRTMVTVLRFCRSWSWSSEPRVSCCSLVERDFYREAYSCT